VVGSERRVFSAIECVSTDQGHDFGTNRKCVCDFLLAINSNFGPTLHRFCDTVTYWLKIANFSYPTFHLMPSLGVNPFEFLDEQKTSPNWAIRR